MLPCFHILAKVEMTEERVFLTPLVLSQNRSRKYWKFHRKAGQFSFYCRKLPQHFF